MAESKSDIQRNYFSNTDEYITIGFLSQETLTGNLHGLEEAIEGAAGVIIAYGNRMPRIYTRNTNKLFSFSDLEKLAKAATTLHDLGFITDDDTEGIEHDIFDFAYHFNAHQSKDKVDAIIQINVATGKVEYFAWDDLRSDKSAVDAIYDNLEPFLEKGGEKE